MWSTGIIVAWTPTIYICPGWMWKAPPMFKISPPHLIILVIYVITSYDQPSADAIIVVDGLECAV